MAVALDPARRAGSSSPRWLWRLAKRRSPSN